MCGGGERLRDHRPCGDRDLDRDRDRPRLRREGLLAFSSAVEADVVAGRPRRSANDLPPDLPAPSRCFSWTGFDVCDLDDAGPVGRSKPSLPVARLRGEGDRDVERCRSRREGLRLGDLDLDLDLDLCRLMRSLKCDRERERDRALELSFRLRCLSRLRLRRLVSRLRSRSVWRGR